MEPKRNRFIAATGFAVALLILGGNVAVICAGNGTAEDTQSTVARPRTKTEPGQKTAGDEETEPATPTEDDPCADLAPKALGVYMGGVLYDRLGSYDLVWWFGVLLGIAAGLVHLPIRETGVARLTPRTA